MTLNKKNKNPLYRLTVDTLHCLFETSAAHSVSIRRVSFKNAASTMLWPRERPRHTRVRSHKLHTR